MLAVLAYTEGDHVDRVSLAQLASVPAGHIDDAIAALERWHLVQEAMPNRFALHAVVRYAVQKRTKPVAPALRIERLLARLSDAPGHA